MSDKNKPDGDKPLEIKPLDSESDDLASDEVDSEEGSFYVAENAPDSHPEFESRAETIYKGPERRKHDRRRRADRRQDVRFELDKEDRRKNGGRRSTDNSPKYY